MTRTPIILALLALLLNQGRAMAAPHVPAFDVASITPCKPGTAAPPMEHAGIADFISPGGRFTARATTLEFLLEWAYGIQPSQHFGGPSWIGADRFDVVAQAGYDATDEEMKAMVRTLLAERFQLKLRQERRAISAYVISPGNDAPKMFPPKEGDIHALKFEPQAGPDQKVKAYRILATRFTIRQLTDLFARQLGGVIVNNTGLDGEYNFTFELAPDDSRPNPMDPGLLLSALHEQLGLTVKSQKANVDFYVVEDAQKVMAGN